MKNIILQINLLILVQLFSSSSALAKVDSESPAIRFVATFDAESVLQALRDDSRFANLELNYHGTPLKMLVSHRQEMTAGGLATGLPSAFFTGLTLGLVPLVVNADMVLDYQLFLHDAPIVSLSYRKNFTDVDFLFGDNINKLEPSQLQWVESTVDTFLHDIDRNPHLKRLIAEHSYYFGE